MTLPNTVDTGEINELEALVAIDDDIKREKGRIYFPDQSFRIPICGFIIRRGLPTDKSRFFANWITRK